MAKDVEATWVSILSDNLKKMSLEEETQPCGEGEGREEEGREKNGEEERKGKKREESGQKVVEELKDNLRYFVDAWTS